MARKKGGGGSRPKKAGMMSNTTRRPNKSKKKPTLASVGKKIRKMAGEAKVIGDHYRKQRK